MEPATRRRLIVRTQRYVLNPPAKVAVFLGLVPGYALIETIGRRTGRRRRNVVGVHQQGDVVWIVAEQGRHAGYVRNLEANPTVRLRIRGRWRAGSAMTVADDDPEQRLEQFGQPGHAKAVRRFGTELATVRVQLWR